MSDYRVKLDIYNGPLDLLLYLIRRDEVDINDIPIARITEQYLEYVDLLKEFDIDMAGEFLVMAATLMEVKSAMLLPRGEVEGEEEEDLGDPRLELVRQLLEYKKYKDVAGGLGESAQEQAQRFGRSTADLRRLRDEQRMEQELDVESLQIWDLFAVFSRLMQATLAQQRGHEVIQDDTPIDVYEVDLLDRAQKENPLTFEAVFVGRSRGEMIGLFLALLELIRQNLVRVEQEAAFGAIYIFAQTDEVAELAVAHAMSADIDKLPSEITGRHATVGDEAPKESSTPAAGGEALQEEPVEDDQGESDDG